ncbi:hypothetical protein Q4567_06575, partial [Aliiglaciecola sp. 2_MG-2023]|uniref:hypothetical protein n=1 Tax=unclassified Aliiglaciecola TaxID=2593648 RepID=UPI0026E4793E
MLQKSGDAFYSVIRVGGGFSPAVVVRCSWPKGHATNSPPVDGGFIPYNASNIIHGLKAMLQINCTL